MKYYIFKVWYIYLNFELILSFSSSCYSWNFPPFWCNCPRSAPGTCPRTVSNRLPAYRFLGRTDMGSERGLSPGQHLSKLSKLKGLCDLKTRNVAPGWSKFSSGGWFALGLQRRSPEHAISTACLPLPWYDLRWIRRVTGNQWSNNLSSFFVNSKV